MAGKRKQTKSRKQSSNSKSREWVVVSDWFSNEPVRYRGKDAGSVAKKIARDMKEAFGVNYVFTTHGDLIRIRWIDGKWAGEDGRIFEGEKAFKRDVWLRHPKWETVAVPID